MINTIFIVEDQSFFSNLIADAFLLADIYAKKIIINTGEKALKYYESVLDNKPDLVLIDIDLLGSDITGFEVLRRINYDLGNDVVIGTISEEYNEEEIARSVKLGALFYLCKTDDLVPRLEELKRDYPSFKNRTGKFKIYR